MRTLSDAPDRQNEHDPLHARRCLDLKARCLSLSLSIDVLLRYGGLWRMIVVLHLYCRSRVIPQDSSGQRGGSREQLTSDWRTKKRDPSFRLLLLRYSLLSEFSRFSLYQGGGMSSSQWPSRLKPGAVDLTSFLRGHGLLGLLAGGNEHTRVVSGYVHDPGLFSGRSVLSWSGPYGGYRLHPVASVLNRSFSGPERRSPSLFSGPRPVLLAYAGIL